MSAPLGIIAGSGALPAEVITAAKNRNQPVFAIAFEGITDRETVLEIPHTWVHIGRVGEIIKSLRVEGVREVLMAGRVGRPAFSSLHMDYTALRLVRKLAKLSSLGDDKVFSTIIHFLEEEDFRVVGVQDVLPELVLEQGLIGNIPPDRAAENDISIGRRVALAIGELDIGQAAIVQQGVVLGVEGLEGTDQLMARCAALHSEGKGGVLVKMKKPGQDTRVDLPSIGVHTIQNAHNAKLRGIAVEAGGSLIINRAAVVETADSLGLFLIGI